MHPRRRLHDTTLSFKGHLSCFFLITQHRPDLKPIRSSFPSFAVNSICPYKSREEAASFSKCATFTRILLPFLQRRHNASNSEDIVAAPETLFECFQVSETFEEPQMPRSQYLLQAPSSDVVLQLYLRSAISIS
jgi:hypothetical protein